MKRVLSLLLVLLLGFSFISCSKGENTTTPTAEKELTDITFVLDWTPNTNHTGIYVAKEMGYFKEAGFNVDIVQPPDDGAEMLVASGKAQFGVSFQDYLMPAVTGENPMPVLAVAAILQHNTSGIISAREKGIASPKDMEGHSYATWDLDIEKKTLKQVVEKDGGDFEKIELIPSTVTDEPTALATDMVDSIWVYEGWAKIACDIAGIETNYFNFKDIDPVFDYYSPVIMGNSDWMSANPDATKEFLGACEKGYNYCVENPEKAADILLSAAPELDKELVYESQQFMVDQYIAEADKWGVFNADRWDNFYKWIVEQEIVDYDIENGCGYTNEYIR